MAGYFDYLKKLNQVQGGGDPGGEAGAPGGLTSDDPFGDYGKWLDAAASYNQTRVPGLPGLESSLSEQIAGLINPSGFFPDTLRKSAELSGMRGLSTSPAAGVLAARMTDDERLRRLQLGSDLMGAAADRYPIANLPSSESFMLSPAQSGQLELGWANIDKDLKALRAQLQAERDLAKLESDTQLKLRGRDPNQGYLDWRDYAAVPGFPTTYFNWG